MYGYKAYIDTPDGSFVIGYGYDNLADVRYDYPEPWFDVYRKPDGFHIQRKTWTEIEREMQE